MENYEKLYKEALERARKLATDLPNGRNDRLYHVWDLESIFPELKESEDEKIRKEIIQSIQDNMCVIHKDKCIAWLEKQGEQKPADKNEPKFKVGDIIKYIGEREEFSKENHTIKKILDDCYLTIDDMYIPFRFENCYILVNQNSSWSEEDEANMDAVWRACGQVYGVKYQSILGDWLKSLKDRVQPQPKQEWSEEDDEMLNLITARLHSHPNIDLEEYSKEYDWLNYRLKYLRPQSHWKPSDEQMDALKSSTYCQNKQMSKVLFGLYQDLLKLRE